MVQVLKTEYWSRADAFLLPLTGLSKSERYEMESYLFWNEFSIDDYRLVLTFSHTDKDAFDSYCRSYIFPNLDKKGYLVESYDVGERAILILDMSEWALDIQMFMDGKYSKFSREAKDKIESFHTFNKNKIPIHVYAVLYPHMKMRLLDDMTPIEYVSEHYGFPLRSLEKIGEIGSVYDEMSETLITNIDDLCQSDT